MSLTTDPGYNFPDDGGSWWEREKKEARERFLFFVCSIPEYALYAWLTFGVFDLGLASLVTGWAVGVLLPFLAFPMYVLGENRAAEYLPARLHNFAQKHDLMDWFGFEVRAFTARILLFAFVITCVAGLASFGIDENVALIGALGILALSLPTFLVYYVMSAQKEQEDEDG